MERQSLGQIEISIPEFRNKSIFEFMEVLSSKIFKPIEFGEVICMRKSSCFMGRYADIHTEFVREMGSATVWLISALLHSDISRTKFIFQYTLTTDLWDHQIECAAV